MPQAIIYLGGEENRIVLEFSKGWGLSKHETVLRIIRDFSKSKEIQELKDG